MRKIITSVASSSGYYQLHNHCLTSTFTKKHFVSISFSEEMQQKLVVYPQQMKQEPSLGRTIS
jgi:hypothetical protein